jgi:preprotein translocase subunit SecG
MYYFLLTLLVIDALLLGLVVMLQAGQGGGLASLGGGTTDNVLGGRQATTLLHQLSWGFGGALMVLSLLLSVVASNRTAGMTDVQRQLRTAPQPTPIAPLNPEVVPPPGAEPPSPNPQ